MCGIFFYKGQKYTLEEIQSSIDSVSTRGPDKTDIVIKGDITMAFHRLSIMDTSNSGSQPMNHPLDKNITLMCNGEIYNFKELIKKYNFKEYNSGSDCEIILWMYKMFGLEKTLKELDGVFSLILIDNDKIMIARDPYGVRPLFYNFDKEIYVSSVLKGISELTEFSEQFPPGHYWTNTTKNFIRWYNNSYYVSQFPPDEKIILKNIRNLYLIRKIITSIEI